MVNSCPKCGYQWTEQIRSTGKYSANHAIHGFASQLEKLSDSGTSKQGFIEEAARRASIPSHVNGFGAIEYLHESKWSKEQASKVIEALREIAEFLNVRLVEINE